MSDIVQTRLYCRALLALSKPLSTVVSWTLCTVKDDFYFGLRPGSQLDVESTIGIRAKRSEWNEGDPIPPESLGKVFDPFWRRAPPQNPEGLGLGLHICSQIVRAHGGKLTVASTRQNGTMFTARFLLRLLS